MPLHVKIKLFLKRFLPKKLFGYVLFLWRITLARFFVDRTIHDYTVILYVEKNGYEVTGGPFLGMHYINASAGSTYLLKLIGCYEAVLHPYIEIIKNEHYDTIIDIGCAEGYYLVGIGRALPQAKLIGYDIDEHALSLTKKLAEHNQLSNALVLDTTCTIEKLTQQITDNTLLICDAEGFENEILNPEICPALSNVKKFVVETHEFAAPGVVEALIKRFSSSHNIEPVTFSMADPEKYPFLQTITNKHDLYHLLRERGEQEQVWLIMTRN